MSACLSPSGAIPRRDFNEKNDKQHKNTFFVDKNSIKNLASALKSDMFLEIDFDDANLGVNIYGSSKKESQRLQKENCKKVLAVFRELKKVICFAKRHSIQLGSQIVVKNLSQKKNNNDLMLEYMLQVCFETPAFKKVSKAVDLACDWLDNENNVFKMCDFVDNKCAKARARGFERMTGCCPAKCKFMDNCPCKTKNISCKFIFCDYLEERGYCISPLTLPIFVEFLSFPQRVASWGLFFKSQKKVSRILHFVKFLTYFVGATIILIVLKLSGLI